MSKLIAVWGSPESGKTTFSVKLAEAVNNRGKSGAGTQNLHSGASSAIVVLTDIVTPVIPTVFPNKRESEIFSLGEILSKIDITKNTVVSNSIFIKDRKNLAFLGYKKYENHYSYPDNTEDKINLFYSVLKANTEFVIVDCTTLPENDLLTRIALKSADMTIRLCTPDFKCLNFWMSQRPIFMRMGYMKDTDVQVMNVPCAERQSAASEMRNQFGKVDFTVPFSSALLRQTMEGTLTEETADRKYNAVIKEIRDRVVRV